MIMMMMIIIINIIIMTLMLIIINTLVLNRGKPKGTNCTTEENEFPSALHPRTWTPVAGHMFYNFG